MDSLDFIKKCDSCVVKGIPFRQFSFRSQGDGVLRAVRIRAALLTRTEAESERAESEGRSRTQKWVSDGEHAEG